MGETPVIRLFRAEKVPPPRGEALNPDIFKVNTQIDIEIGCGNGLFAMNYAEQYPDRTVIAIEKTSTRFRHFRNRLKMSLKPLPNLFPIHADGVSWVTHRVPEESVDQYFIFYPNPYPKKKQANLRWTNMPFLGRLLSTLKTGGKITFRTNIESYAVETRTNLEKIWGLEITHFHRRTDRTHPLYRPVTQFELKYFERGETCFEVGALKPFLTDLKRL